MTDSIEGWEPLSFCSFACRPCSATLGMSPLERQAARLLGERLGYSAVRLYRLIRRYAVTVRRTAGGAAGVRIIW